MKRVLVLSDLHCGHVMGLTPPRYHQHEYQEKFWEWFRTKVAVLGKVDVLVVNGDAIDGKNTKAGGQHIYEASRIAQVDIAAECLSLVKAKRIYIVRGTEYHTGVEEDFENILSQQIGTDGVAYDALPINIGGLDFHFKHHTGNSSVPWTRGAAAVRSHVWQILERSLSGQKTPPDVSVRSHVHYFVQTRSSLGTVLTTPALQLSSSYGVRRCDGIHDVGFVYFDIENKNSWSLSLQQLREVLPDQTVVVK